MWGQRLTEVADWIDKYRQPPRRNKDARFESTLATWLVTQRGLHRRGALDPARRARLDERLPGWDTG